MDVHTQLWERSRVHNILVVYLGGLAAVLHTGPACQRAFLPPNVVSEGLFHSGRMYRGDVLSVSLTLAL